METPPAQPSRSRALAEQSLPAVISESPMKAAEYAELSKGDQRFATVEVINRWAGDLTDDDWTLAEVVRLEKRRLANLATIRQGAELTDMEWRLWRFLVRHDGRVRTYVQIAHHLWGTSERPITPRMLRVEGGFDNIYIQAIRRYVGSLRRKIEVDITRPQHLASVRGVGYCWYAAPPTLDDGVNYASRDAQHTRLRYDMLGLLNPDALSLTGDRPDDYLDADVVDAVSVAEDQQVYERRQVQPGPEFDRLMERRSKSRAPHTLTDDEEE